MFSRRSSSPAKPGPDRSTDTRSAEPTKGARKSEAASTGPADSRPEGGPGKKGRPTPTRKEAEQRRREAVKPVVGRAARKQSAKERAADRAVRLEAIKRGDERYLPARDKGPARAMIRDLIDSRLTAAEFFLPLAVVVLACSLTGSRAATAIATNIWALMVVVIGVDLFILMRRIRRRVTAAFPQERRRGLGTYGMMRALTLRRFRTPAPRVQRGARV